MNYTYAERQFEEMEIPGSRRAVPRVCPEPVSIEIARFPQHSTSVTALPPTERSKIRQAALAIVQSFDGGCPAPFGRVVITGHADRDVQMGPAFEMQISLKRAEAVRSALRQEVLALSRKSGAPPPVMSKWVIEGLGATQLRVPIARNEADRLLNRRAVLELAAAIAPPASNDLFRQCLQRCTARKAQCLAHTDPHVRNLCLGLLQDFCRTCVRARPGR